MKKVAEKEDRIRKTQYKINYFEKDIRQQLNHFLGDNTIVPYRPLVSRLQKNYTKYFKRTKKNKKYRVSSSDIL